MEQACIQKKAFLHKKLIEQLLSGRVEIKPPVPLYSRFVKKNWDEIAKPLDSLGRFEEVTMRMGGILEDTTLSLEKKAVLVFCADNGVVEEGISQSGQEVTLAVAKSMGRQTSSVGRMAKTVGAAVIPVDIGMNTEELVTGVLSLKVAKGTKNFAKEPAMTEEEVLQAMGIGMELVRQCKEEGYRLIGTGEMGIGNTTTSSAVIAALLRRPAEEIVGKGAGLSEEGLAKKKQIVAEAIQKYPLIVGTEEDVTDSSTSRIGDNGGQQADAFTVLRTVGGLDLAGLAGVMLGGAIFQIPIILDGVITAAAALLAVRMVPAVKDYLFASHMGKEPAMELVYRELGLQPVIYGDLALGEGTGAVMYFSLLDTVLAVYHEQTTFQDISIEAYHRK